MITHQPVDNHNDLLKVVDGLLEEAGLDRKDLGGTLTFAGMDPIRPTELKVGCASAAITGANAVASSLIWKLRSGEGQDIHIDLRKTYVSHSAWQDTLAKCTLIHIEKIGDSDPEPLGPTERPLAGMRALGMVHVVAGLPGEFLRFGKHQSDSEPKGTNGGSST